VKPIKPILKTLGVLNFLLLTTMLNNNPANAEFGGESYDPNNSTTPTYVNDSESEQKLREEFNKTLQTTSQTTTNQNNDIDAQLQNQNHITPIQSLPLPPIVQTAIEDPKGQLNGTPCKNEYYTGRGVVVDISDQRLRVYDTVSSDDVLSCKEIAIFKVTTGKDSKNTPVGEYYLGGLEKHKVAGFNIDWMTFLYSNKSFWGVHPAPWQPTNFGDPNYRILNGSKGCVRVETKSWPDLLKLLFKGLFFKIQE
jgi:hypothetical protein